ncbi:CocE/NonD family hydrolase [Amycolatopsis sp. RTGN1]|uniref:CocE/NonD family hydrolase n=1 Tax=Amycolatopsis ponsaeliensis TaxID=2992142 RepID=UPI00254CAC1C|nr:CocE/NonD family hydrolase [Amycolatopsis sp. RTGN1]
MKPLSHLIQRVLHLDPPLTRSVIHQRDLRIPMPDGTVLLTDRWVRRSGGDGLPVALLRSPYGRRGLIGAVQGRVLAERGFQTLIQSTRGTHGSGGMFDPMRQERDDGLATLEWVIKQPWFGESIVLVGASYLGYVQWAVADQLPPEVKAMIPNNTESALTLEFLRPDGFSLETPFIWGVTNAVEKPAGMIGGLAGIRKKQRALETLPLNRADIAATGQSVGYIQDILRHEADSPRWDGLDHSHRVPNVTVPVSSVGGWFDLFLPGQLRDFRALQASSPHPRLTIGPWTHVTSDATPIREALTFGLALARGQRPPERASVHLYVMGQEAWREFETWPPSGYAPQRFHLRPGGALSVDLPDESEPDRYRYDPNNPTPAVGGVRANGGGRKDNTKLEARSDVLTYTTTVLDQDVEVVGEVSAEIWFRSSLPFADVFVRLCDVDGSGRSVNVCDGLTTLTNADELARATVRLWPTAYQFRRGHRIRVQVSSGAFPRYARNPGTGEPHASATRLRAAEQEVHHDPNHPSAIVLPVAQHQ